MIAFVLTGASDRPRVTLLTALPLVWGEGDVADVLAGRTARSDTLKALDGFVDIRAIDTLSVATLGTDIAIIAQPRRLTPTELVAFDGWVRRGGRAMIFADPELVWPSRYAPGDNRRAPPVTLLDPLFAYWGVALGDSDQQERAVQLSGSQVTLLAAGTWTGPTNCSGTGTYVLDCKIGKGHVILVGDADLLDARLWQGRRTDNATWLSQQLFRLGDKDQSQSTRTLDAAVAAVAIAGAIALALMYRRFRRT